MRKIFSFFAAALVAVAVNAQTDFAAPGYSCAADDAVLSGGGDNFTLNTELDPHQIQWSDVGLSSNALATWTVEATRGCYVSVSLDLGPVIASNKHIFEVKILDANANIRGTVAEPAENADADQVKALDGTILLPVAGTYTIELRNNRDWGKGRIKNVILTYAADAPSEIIAVSSVELNKNEVTLDVQEVELLVATVNPDNATDPSVTWETSDAEVATVSENGLILAVAEGTATITAKAGEKSAACAVTVAAAAVPDVDFSEPCVLAGKVAHLEGAIWKNEAYKLYGDGGHNKNYGSASWTINVTNACTVNATLNGVEGGHLFELDLIKGEEPVATIAQPDGTTWNAGEIALNGTLTFAEAGVYTLKLRNTQEWSSGKVASITLSLPEVVLPYMAIIGDMNSWSGDELIPAADKLSASVTIHLDMNENSGYGFKVLVGEKAYCIQPGEQWYAFHRGHTSASGIDYEASSEEAFWLQIDVAGDYTFTWTIAEKKLEITFPEIQHTYTVAGGSADLFGTTWDPANAANDMTLVEGLYTWEKTELTLAAGSIGFKVCQDHDWNPAYPAQDYQLNIPEAGIYTITITFNADTKEVNAVATKTGSAVVIPTVAMHGDFTKNGWNDTELFTLAEDKLKASLTLNLAADHYEFGMRIGGSGNWTANGATLTREANSTDLSVGSGNMKLIADVAGDYIFTYTFETNTLAVTFPIGAGIDNTAVEAKAIKRIVNGQLFIEMNGVLYNAQGTIVR